MSDKKTKMNFDLQELGEFFAKFTEHSEHVYWISSADFKKIQFISPSYERIWGRPREELYLNPESWITFLHPDDVVHYHPIHEMAKKVSLLGEKARYAENYRIIRPDGEVRWIMDHGFPICNEQGECFGVTGIACDVTHAKQTECQLKIAKEHAEAANLAKTEFIAHMSHDIRTPLTGLIGMSNRLIECSHTPEQKQYATWVHESSHQLLNLLNSILDVVSSQKVCPHDVAHDFFNLRACIQDLIELERPSIEMKGLTLQVNIAPEVPNYVLCDRHKIHRILLNILGNAIKFTPVGTIRLDVTSRSLHTTQSQVYFQITDTGIGIAPDRQAHIFDEFYRVSPAYQGHYTGHGVGLSIVQSYVHLLGGEITCNSVLGQGTQFSFDLPLTIAHPSAHPPAPAVCESSIQHMPASIKPQILLVEDNPMALHIIENLVQRLNYPYQSAMDAETALTLIAQHDIDCIITDIGLPGLSGYELAQKIRQEEEQLQKKPIPIIGLTAHADAQIKQRCLQAGMQDALSKPMTLQMLSQILQYYGTLTRTGDNT